MTPAQFKSIRKDLRLSQNELGELIGMSGRNVRRIEHRIKSASDYPDIGLLLAEKMQSLAAGV